MDKETIAQSMKEENFDTRKLFHLKIEGAQYYLRHALQKKLGDKYQWLQEYEQVCEWLEDNKEKSLLLVGNCGTGKSMIACEFIPLLLQYLFNLHFKPLTATQFSKLERIEWRRLWIIDDLGCERRVKEYGTEKDNFSEMIDTLEKDGGCAIITTNLTFEQLSSRYGDRNTDRMRKLFQCVVINHKSMR